MKYRMHGFILLLLALLLVLTGCESADQMVFGLDKEQEVHHGGLGDTMSTAFFDFAITTAVLADEYQGLAPTEGRMFLICDMTLTGTAEVDSSMYQNDFWTFWEDGGEDFSVAVSNFFQEYVLRPQETVSKTYVFQVPERTAEITYQVVFTEVFENETVGDYHIVSLRL